MENKYDQLSEKQTISIIEIEARAILAIVITTVVLMIFSICFFCYIINEQNEVINKNNIEINTKLNTIGCEVSQINNKLNRIDKTIKNEKDK